LALRLLVMWTGPFCSPPVRSPGRFCPLLRMKERKSGHWIAKAHQQAIEVSEK
jgi:hypothetical protein